MNPALVAAAAMAGLLASVPASAHLSPAMPEAAVALAGGDAHDPTHPKPLIRVADNAQHEMHGHHGAMKSDQPGQVSHGDITLSRGYARASIGQAANSAAYVTLSTTGAPDALLSVSSPVAEAVELHTHKTEDGVMKMRQVEEVPVTPDAPTQFSPGGLHIMIIGVKERLEAGSTIPMTLTFRDAGPVTVELPVLGLGETPPPGGGHDHH